MWVRVRVRGVIMLKTACTSWLLSCKETAATTANAAASIAAIPVAISVAIGIVAVNAHVPIQVARLRESKQKLGS